jgi:hypothetical protein
VKSCVVGLSRGRATYPGTTGVGDAEGGTGGGDTRLGLLTGAIGIAARTFASAHEVGCVLHNAGASIFDGAAHSTSFPYGLGGWRRPQGWLWLSRVRGPAWPQAQPAAWPRVSCMNCKRATGVK